MYLTSPDEAAEGGNATVHGSGCYRRDYLFHDDDLVLVPALEYLFFHTTKEITLICHKING
jgi:hypothetical protein